MNSKKNASETLANFGLTISDAVKILLTRIEKEGGLPAGLTTDPEAYDEWFRDKVRQAMEDPRPGFPMIRLQRRSGQTYGRTSVNSRLMAIAGRNAGPAG
jgi:antitoxin component of RelBE/YafQ-DinJ toxin-antitoxin module